jgi:hypothetical protein
MQLVSARPSRPDLLVVIADDATDMQVEAVWKLIETPPAPTPRTVTRQDHGRVRRLRISFHAGGEESAQAALLDRLGGSPYVTSVYEVGRDEDEPGH